MTDKMLKIAMKEVYEQEYSELQSKMKQEPVHIFSNKFKRNMDLLIYGRKSRVKADKQKRAGIHYKFRYAFVAILILIFATTTAFAIKPIRGKLEHAFYTVFTDRVTIENQENVEKDADDSDVINWKEPQYVPKGFQLEFREKNEDVNHYIISWVGKNEETLSYIQGKSDSMSLSLSANDQKPKDIKIGNKNAKMVVDDSGTRSIFFEENGVIYSITGHISEEELVDMAKSIQ